jgi:CMP-N-acetylneuraminic acid synthetase
MSTIALIPARSGSKGIPSKNFRELGGKTLVQHAIACGHAAGIDLQGDFYSIHRPAELAQDDTPMIAVVRHALQQIPGQPDDIIVLLQPTQPLRRPEHVQQAITLLRESQADSVVSVVEVPPIVHPYLQLAEAGGFLWPYEDFNWDDVPTRRQDVPPTFRRDGTVYAFWRKTVDQHGSIYGQDVRPLIIDPADSCELDTESDWAALEQRWKERHEAGQW